MEFTLATKKIVKEIFSIRGWLVPNLPGNYLSGDLKVTYTNCIEKGQV